MLTQKEQKVANFYECKKCDYVTYRKSNYEKHLSTQKHENRENANNANKKKQKVANFECSCGKNYKFSSSLSKHKRTCKIEEECQLIPPTIEPITDASKVDYKNMFMTILNENKELQKTVFEQQKQIGELIPKVGNNNNNSIKNRFNIKIFLNEECRDALTIDEFINKLDVSMKNLITTGDKGLVEGISDIIAENMKKLSLYERPIHCTDKKRETLYIKNSEWEKDENNDKIRDAFKKISHKQFRKIKQWIEENPTYQDDDKLQQKYIKLVTKCTESLNENERKLIKNVCDNVYLDNK
jgi:hypothetical protein